MRKQLALIIVLAAGLQVSAQDTAMAPGGRLQILQTKNPWLQSDNAAGLEQVALRSLGQTYAAWEQEDGGFHRPQQPSRASRLRFVSERYQKLQGMSLYGRFAFTQSWEKDIRMSDVLDPYRRNPYVLADSLGGDWKKQWYDLALKAASAPIAGGKLVAGAGLTYRVGTGARQSDPRPVNYSNEIGLRPSLLWKITPQVSLGANGRFDFYKENINMEVSNNEDNHYIYRLAGLGRFYSENLAAGGFTRYYDGHTNGGELQLAVAHKGWQALLRGGYALRLEEATDGSSLSRQVGTLRENQYHLSGTFQLAAASLTHQLTAAWDGFSGEGTDYHLVQNKDTRLFDVVNDDILTTTYYNHADLTYRLIGNRSAGDYRWLLEAAMGYAGMDNRSLVPRLRHTVDALEYRMAYRHNHALSGSRNLQWGLHTRWRDCFTAYNDFRPLEEQTTLVVDQYLAPDHAWLSSDWLQAGVSVQYSFPMSGKASAAWFVRGAGNGLFPAGRKPGGITGNRTSLGLTIGVLY